jgi:hypothetical protein
VFYSLIAAEHSPAVEIDEAELLPESGGPVPATLPATVPA